MAFAFSSICVQSAINLLGTDVIAGSIAAFNLELFAYYILTGFGIACTTLAGQNYGAGNFDRPQLSFRTCMILGLAFYLASEALLLLFGLQLLSLSGASEEVIDIGMIR